MTKEEKMILLVEFLETNLPAEDGALLGDLVKIYKIFKKYTSIDNQWRGSENIGFVCDKVITGNGQTLTKEEADKIGEYIL